MVQTATKVVANWEDMRKVLVSKLMSRCMGCMSCMFACARRVRGTINVLKSAIRVKTKGGYSSGAMGATHCLGCEEPPCIDSCPKGALTKRVGGGIRLHKELCDGCKSCLTGCPVEAIFWDEEEGLPIFCIHCGNCVKFCPHNCLSLEEIR